MKYTEQQHYPESVLTKDRAGNIEVRNLIARGEFVLYDYRDPVSFKPVESSKQKLYLRSADGTIMECFLIPTKSPDRMLLIKPKVKETKDRMVWNDAKKIPEGLWK